MQTAIIDIGTNTCNLLITEPDNNLGFKIHFSGIFPTKLGKGGINSKTITPDAIQRGIKAIKHWNNIIKTYPVDKTYAFATSAVRSADNGDEFCQEIKKHCGVDVKLISGDKEAELIYKGVKQSVPFGDEKILIVDIGGGSNELIIANRDKIFWKKSFPLGMARLLEKINPKDPIKKEQIEEIITYLKENMTDFFKAFGLHQPKLLAGASGAFETFTALLEAKKIINKAGKSYCQIPMEAYNNLHLELLRSTLEQRKEMKGMELMRVEMIVLASIFTSFILDETNIPILIQTDFSLKEGAIAEILGLE